MLIKSLLLLVLTNIECKLELNFNGNLKEKVNILDLTTDMPHGEMKFKSASENTSEPDGPLFLKIKTELHIIHCFHVEITFKIKHKLC